MFNIYDSHSLGEIALKGLANTGAYLAKKGVAKAIKSDYAKKKIKNVANKYLDQALDSFTSDLSKKLGSGTDVKKTEAYCGINEVPYGKHLGSMDECAKQKQVRLYGKYKIDKRTLESANKVKRITNKVQLASKRGELVGKIKAIKKKLAEEKDEKKIIKLKQDGQKLLHKLDEVQRQMKGQGLDIHKAILKVAPKKGFVMPGHKYTGPGNPLEEQLKYDPNTGQILEIYQQPTGRTDAVSMQHDVDYSVCGNKPKSDQVKCKNNADRKMVKALDAIPWKERQWGHAIARNAIAAKSKLGMGAKKSKNVKSRRVKKTGKKN